MKLQKSLIIGGLALLLTGCVLPWENYEPQGGTPQGETEKKDEEQQPVTPDPGGEQGGGEQGGGEIIPDPPKEKSFIPEVGEVRLLFSHGTAGETRIYNYCPSIFVDENNKEHVYYCSNKDEGNVTDYVGYRVGSIANNEISYSNINYVLEHSTPTSVWDSRHTCDPSVIKGEFKYQGETYYYMMAYLGCLTSNSCLNETGIAVSKTPQGPWVKCNSLKADGVTPINPIVPYSEFTMNSNSWGTGQPSLVSVDKKGKVLLFTTIGSATGTYTNLREYDFSDIDNYVLVRQRNSITTEGIKGTVSGASLINNADFGYDEVNHRVIMAKPRQYFGTDNKSPNFVADTIDVYYIDDTEGTKVGDVLFAGNNTSKFWKSVGEVNQSLTGFLRNHNTGLITDPYGRIDATKNVGVAFTRSDEETGGTWSYLSTYRIYATGLALPKNYLK